MKHNDATRIWQAVDRRVEKKLGIQMETTWGTVDSIAADGKTCAVMLYGETTTASDGFRIPGDLTFSVGDSVKVAMDNRGDRWVYDVGIGSAHKKVTVNPTTGEIAFGDGTTAPTIVLTRDGLFLPVQIGDTLLDGSGLYADRVSALHSAYYGDNVLLTPQTTESTDDTLRFQNNVPGGGPTLLEVAGLLGGFDQQARFKKYVGDANPVLDIGYRASPTRPEIRFGAGGASAVDVNLYRSAANVLATDDQFNAVGGLQINGNNVLYYVPLSAFIDVFAGSTTTSDILNATTSEVTSLPTQVVAVHGVIIAKISAINSGAYLLVKGYGSSAYGGIAYLEVANQFVASAFIAATGGTNNRQFGYEVKVNSTATFTYYIRIAGYWRTA